MKIQSGSKNIEIESVKKVSEIGKIIGLMFSQRENARALLFEFQKPTKIKIHSFFVFYKFLAVWLDDKNRIIKMEIVKPFQFNLAPKQFFSKLIEIPINNFYRHKVNSLVGKEVK